MAPVACVRVPPSIQNREARDVEKWVRKGMFGVRERSPRNSGGTLWRRVPMEATDPADVEPRLSYAVHGSIGGGGTRHMKATERLFKTEKKRLKSPNVNLI